MLQQHVTVLKHLMIPGRKRSQTHLGSFASPLHCEASPHRKGAGLSFCDERHSHREQTCLAKLRTACQCTTSRPLGCWLPFLVGQAGAICVALLTEKESRESRKACKIADAATSLALLGEIVLGEPEKWCSKKRDKEIEPSEIWKKSTGRMHAMGCAFPLCSCQTRCHLDRKRQTCPRLEVHITQLPRTTPVAASCHGTHPRASAPTLSLPVGRACFRVPTCAAALANILSIAMR